MKSFLLLFLVAGPALADNNAIMNCRQVQDPAKRLACYDAIGVQPRTAAAAPAAPASAPASEVKAASAPVAAAPAQAAAAPVKAEQMFGLEEKQKKEIDEIASSIIGKFDGWGPGSLLRLSNGQVWRVADDSGGTMHEKDGPKVIITRGALGSFYMEIEGSRQAPKVTRVR
jgi:hypothetical protein